MSLTIDFNIINKNVLLPERHGAYYDLFIPEEVTVGAFLNSLKIPLGFSCKLPEGYHAEIVMRSSTYSKYGLILTNGVGIIDNDYCGPEDEWILSVKCLSSFIGGEFCAKGFKIPAGTRLAQFTVVPDCPKLLFNVDGTRVDTEVSNSKQDANRGGFGSTGN